MNEDDLLHELPDTYYSRISSKYIRKCHVLPVMDGYLIQKYPNLESLDPFWSKTNFGSKCNGSFMAWISSTVEDLLLFNRNKLFFDEHKVITLKQQFLGILLCFLCIWNGCGYCVSLRKYVRLDLVHSYSFLFFWEKSIFC